MNKFKILLLISCLSSFSAFAQYDDIYFNPKTDIPKKDVRKVVNYSDTDIEQPSSLLDGSVSLTEDDYSYTQRLNAFHNENLLVHIEGNDTTIYDLANGDYNVSVGDNGVDISGNNTNVNNQNPYYANYYDNMGWGWSWNSWYGMPSYYSNYYSYWGWMPSNPWSPFYYDPWYYPYYDCSSSYGSDYHGSSSYSDMSNETYRRQHNSSVRYDGTRNTASTTSSNNVGSRNHEASSTQSLGTTNTRRPQSSTVSTSSNSESTRGSYNSGSTVRVTTSSSDNGSRYSGTSSSSSSSSSNSGSRSGFSSGSHTTSGSGTRTTGTSSGSSSSGSRGGGSSSSGGSRGGGGSTTRR